MSLNIMKLRRVLCTLVLSNKNSYSCRRSFAAKIFTNLSNKWCNHCFVKFTHRSWAVRVNNRLLLNTFRRRKNVMTISISNIPTCIAVRHEREQAAYIAIIVFL